MKAYIATTGILFVLLALAHVFRVVQEPHLGRDPWFLLTTLLSVILAGWAFRLYRSATKSKRPPA
jgi:hypothetical protein